VCGTGAAACHPAPLVEAFEAFQLPDELVRGFGYPHLTEEIKRDIFSSNFIRMHGLDAAALVAAIEGDDIAKAREAGEVEAWSALRT